MQQYKHLKPDEAYHATVERENHDFVVHVATNDLDAFLYWLNSFCNMFPNIYWISHGIGKADAESAECPIYDRVYDMRERLLKGWSI